MNVGELLNDLSGKAGIKGDDAKLKEFLNNQTLAAIVVPDEIATPIIRELMNRDSAANDSGLRGLFHKQALKVPDDTIAEEIADLDEAAKKEILDELSTSKKIKLLKKKFIELTEKKFAIDPKDKESKAKLEKEIERLNGQIKNVEDGANLKVSEMQKDYKQKELDYDVRSYLASKRYAFDKVDHEVNVDTAYGVLQRALAERKAKVVKDASGVKRLVQSDNPDLEYFENNNKVKFGDFADKVLANSNLLFVTDPKKVSQTGQTQFHQNGNGKTLDVSALTTANSAQIAQLEKEQAS